MLLFDDVFDRLDEHRQLLFAQMVDGVTNQVLLTHTSKKYPKSFIDRIGIFDLTPLPEEVKSLGELFGDLVGNLNWKAG